MDTVDRGGSGWSGVPVDGHATEGVPNMGRAGTGDGLGLPGRALAPDAGAAAGGQARCRHMSPGHALVHDAAAEPPRAGVGHPAGFPGHAIVHDAATEAGTGHSDRRLPGF